MSLLETVAERLWLASERLASDQTLRESQESLRQALEAGQFGIWSYDLRAGRGEGSARTWEIFGIEDQQTISMEDWIERIHPDDRASANKAFEVAASGDGIFNMEYRLITTTGETRWVNVVGRMIRGNAGDALWLSGIIADITKRRQAEQRKDEFIALASHELKTPITALKMSAQILKRRLQKEQEEREARGERVRTVGTNADAASDAPSDTASRSNDSFAAKQLSRMDEQLNKLTELVDDLLDVSKIAAGKLDYRLEEVDLDELIGNCVEELRSISDKHSIVLDTLMPGKVLADKDRIAQVLTNLITNAIKFSPQADRVVVRSQVDGGSIVVSVQDFGIGIPKSEQERIFDRFFQSNNLEEGGGTYPGLGLGLYISSQIIKRHGGRIWVESEKGKGSTFYFRIPLASSGQSGGGES